MNKTININLAGVFFHIDEDAYLKLQTYLNSIKQSIKDPQGRDEIIRDIEARIAELFQEKMQEVGLVVSLKQVEEVIAVMGQPEDYVVDDELFEDEPKQKNQKTDVPKKLFRDTKNGYLAGVSTGLAHYFDIESIWMHLLWIFLALFSGGTFILVYLVFWIFVPEAKTTADELHMRGEPVNISNIEKKVKEGFDSVAEKMKGVDYEKYGEQAKTGASAFFDALGKIILFCLNVFVKFIGIILLLIAGATLVSLFFALFGVGLFGVIDAPWIAYVEMASIGVPFWLASLFAFFATAIPFVFLFILGLKILVSNLKSIGTPAKLVLLGLWLISIFALSFLGIRQATQRAFDGEIIISESLPVQKNDTLFLYMKRDKQYGESIRRSTGIEIKYDKSGNKILFSRDVQLQILSTTDSIGHIEIVKYAEGSSNGEATNTANNILYTFDIQGNKLLLDSYLTTQTKNNFKDQEVDVTLYLPTGSILFAGEKTHYFHGYNGILSNSQEGHFLKIKKNTTECLDCPQEINKDEESDNTQIDAKEEEEIIRVRINENGIQINNK